MFVLKIAVIRKMSLGGKLILSALVIIAGKVFQVIEKETNKLFSMALPPLDVDYYRYFLGIGIPGYLIAEA
jgi:hypothetical protein